MSLNMSSEDISRTYGDTYLAIRRNNRIEPLHILGGHERNRMSVRYLNSDGESRLDINSPNLILQFPDSGCYNVERGVASHVSRRAERQWHRGIRNRSLSLTGNARFATDLISAMYNPVHYSFEEALEIVKEDFHNSDRKRCAAITKNFMLMRSYEYENIVIFFRNSIVGEVTSDGVVIDNTAVKNLFEEAIAHAVS